ncbi:unnamed protein product [Spodoptera exigua]|nr:unnamed protein product [Spodoptera exigua]
MNLLPTLKNYGVNSILMEYEDMFPYEGNLANLSSEIAYTKTELTDFLLEAKKLDIEVIPLIQTFGHMEFVLKLAEFSVHRELPYNPGEICPSQPGSLELIRNMLSQPIKYIHIGCDEVYNINDCPNCIRRNLKNHQIYYKHLINVKNIVNDLSPNTKVLFWSEFNYSQKRINLKYELEDYKHELNDLEPIDWEYVGERVNSARLYRMHEVFNRVWFATAFKGADDVHGKEPDIMKRYLNHIHWLNQVLTYKPPKYNVKINGIVLTGWSRVYLPFGPIVMRSGSDDGILEKPRGTFENCRGE